MLLIISVPKDRVLQFLLVDYLLHLKKVATVFIKDRITVISHDSLSEMDSCNPIRPAIFLADLLR